MRDLFNSASSILGALVVSVSSFAIGCDDTRRDAAAGGAGGSTSASTGQGGDPLDGTTELNVPVPESGPVYLSLAKPGLVTPTGDAETSTDWDLAFDGFDVFTNSGPSGSGQGAAFGQLALDDFYSDSVPTVPFTSPDKAGGAFLDWYKYDGTDHVLYARFHVYGVKSRGSLYKVQVLTYYGDQDGAPTSALYQIRYADITSGKGTDQEISVDGTAGGIAAPASATSGCLTLATGKVTQLTTDQIGASKDWDLCFRRDAISVNGEVGGPGDVSAVDLDAAATAGETLTDVEAKTAESEKAAFESIDSSSFADLTFRGDHVVSAFETGRWIDQGASPPAPASAAWLVVDASGQHSFLVAFTAFLQPTTSSPGTVVLHLEPVKGNGQ